MNIAIVGAGIAGISTALELARDGHQVTVYEQMNGAAEAASFAPGGWMLPCSMQSLSTPGCGMPLHQLQSGSDLLQASRLIGTATWRWMRQWKQREKLCPPHTPSAQAQALHQLSLYSQQQRWQDCEDTEMAAERRQGHLILLRSQPEVDFWSERLSLLHSQGMDCQLLNRTQAQSIEPGLGQEISWSHALHLPSGESINPRLWNQYLRYQAQSLGVILHTGTPIHSLSQHPLGVISGAHLYPHEAVVLCTGAQHHLLAQTGVALPTMPVWGYSVTAPVRDPLLAPRAAVMDWAQQATIGRMGQRIRICTGLEMGSSADAVHHTHTLQRMYRLLNDWFPGGAQLSSPQVQTWRGVRALLPDGLPAVGPSQQPGIWLNLAHGHHGVSLAAGCARALADMLTARPPAVDMQAFHPLRF